jgi:hypothetical protein
MGVVEVRAQQDEEVSYLFPFGENQTSDVKVISTSFSVLQPELDHGAGS